MDEEECQCHDARRWRQYWTDEAVGARLRDELRPYQDAYQRALRENINDIRGWRRIYDDPAFWVDAFDHPETRAAQVAPWSAAR